MIFRTLIAFLILATPVYAQDGEPVSEPMTYEQLGRIVFALDPDAIPQGTGFFMNVASVEVLVVTDPEADRMRAMVPIRGADELTDEELKRMMQANFDTALDARYAIANDIVWAVYIHPLSTLQKNEFISGLGQTVNSAISYGTLYSGGLLQYGGGDSGALQRALIDELLKKGEAL